jgi:hypothetical protein
MQRHAAIALALLLGCGDNREPTEIPASFEIVGHSPVNARGMNSALAVAGDTVYVGARNDQAGVAIIDVSDPAAPVVVGEIGPPEQHLPSMSARELRVIPDRNLLIVLNLQCSPDLHGCATVGGEIENLKFYDITDRRDPVLLGRHDVFGTIRSPRSPHEMYIWNDAARALVFLAAPPLGASFEVIDVTDPRVPVVAAAWNPVLDGGVVRRDDESLLHSVGLSPDGRTAYLSYQTSGLLLADVSALPAVTLLTPPANALRWPPISSVGPHSAVAAPGRELLVVTEEIYPMPFSTGCPWGHVRTVDISDPAMPVVVGEFKLPENDPSRCVGEENFAYTAHNVTVTRDLALVSWYAGGLQALDISDPANIVQLAELRPAPLPSVAVEDEVLGGRLVSMWSYPVIQDGLIYVTDSRNGLYILRYHGPHEDQVAGERFLEGNSNL